MIRQLTGAISERGLDFVVIDVSGVGYQVFTTSAVIGEAAERETLFTYLHVKDDALTLYGFTAKDDLKLFIELTKVSGVGPKSALALLDNVGRERLTKAIDESRPELLVVPGVGKKTAERVILELSGRLKKVADDDALKALSGLGYSVAEAQEALRAAGDGTIEERIRAALGELSKKR